MTVLYPLRSEPEEIRRIPRVLSEHGIRFLIIEHLPKTKIDGACFWLDRYSPVIVVSLRYDRIDWFWHSLGHELKHVRDRDVEKEPVLETLLVGEDAQPQNEKPKEEKEADEFAVEFLVDQKELEDFINRHHPLYSRRDVIRFSGRIGVHPGIVVGQLQYLGKIPYSNLRGMLVKVRDIITDSALTDGWGRTISL
jgi:HTH-type transcriptional regulator / antitoxin HigA